MVAIIIPGRFGAIAAGSAGSASTLKNGMIGFWELEEASGSRADSHTNGLTLTENGTVGQVAGKVGNAGSFPSSGNYLSRADAAVFDFSGGLSVAFWTRFPSSVPAADFALVGKWRSSFEWRVMYLNSASRFMVQLFDGSGFPTQNADTFGAASADTWYFIAVTANNTNLKISVNAGTQDSTSQTAIADTAETFRIGEQDVNAATYIDQVGVWGRALTGAEITQLYNSGNGLAYSAM